MMGMEIASEICLEKDQSMYHLQEILFFSDEKLIGQ
jgi:hypothetical protein